MSAFRRLPQGGRIDRAKPVSARFDGKGLPGFTGDTLASALLANDKLLIGRSFKYHRRRGIVGGHSPFDRHAERTRMPRGGQRLRRQHEPATDGRDLGRR